MTTPPPRSAPEAGVALLTALLIVLALAALAVGALETMQRGRRLDSNAASLAQAQWYAIGAEAQVRAIAGEFQGGALGRVAFTKGDRAFAFPLDRGVMEIVVRDGSRCVNLNGVVAGAGDILQRHEVGATQFQALLVELGAPEARAVRLTDALTDWIDTDDGRQSPNADDTPYLNRSPGYLTAGQLLAEVSELRAIDGFTPDIYAALRPHVCALPVVGPTKVNINALTPADAPVLVALSGGALNRRSAEGLIAARPAWGWSEGAEFLAGAQRAGVELPQVLTEQLEADPRYLDLRINVVHLDAEATLTELLVLSGTGFRTVARRWSDDS